MIRAGVYVDGANLWHMKKVLNIDIDLKRLKQFCNELNVFDHISYNYYSAIVLDDNGVPKLDKLLKWLKYNEWNVIEKPASVTTDRYGHSVTKGNMDGEMHVDMMVDAYAGVNNVFLFTGDGDFSALVKAMRRKFVHVTLISSRRSNMMSETLRMQADNYVDIEDMIRHPAYTGGNY